VDYRGGARILADSDLSQPGFRFEAGHVSKRIQPLI
jgi:hypothetical protein